MLTALIGNVFADEVKVKTAKVEFYNAEGDVIKLVSDRIEGDPSAQFIFTKLKMNMMKKSDSKTFKAITDFGKYYVEKKILEFWGHINFISENEFIVWADKFLFYVETKAGFAEGHVKLKRDNTIFNATIVKYNDQEKTFEFPKGVEIQVA